MDTRKIDFLSQRIRARFSCECLHIRSAPVKVFHQGKTRWSGMVEVFHLLHHPHASECYAWTTPQLGGISEPVMYLNLSPISGPEEAVRAHVLPRKPVASAQPGKSWWRRLFKAQRKQAAADTSNSLQT